MKTVIKTIIIDDDPIFRSGLSNQLAQYDEVALLAQADNGDSGLSLVKQHQPDVVLADFHMDGLDGIPLIKKIKQQQPNIKLVTLTRQDDPFVLIQMIEAGSDAIIQKKSDNLIINAIHSVINNRGIIQPEQGMLIVRALLRRQTLLQLTNNELEFFNKIGEGKNYKIIAQEIGIKENSAKNLLSKVKAKLKVKTKQALIDLYQQFFPKHR
jgi:two-component system, NarL family, response regulator LiaR